jgi:diguanylate cyclase (GGDEF)-like protein
MTRHSASGGKVDEESSRLRAQLAEAMAARERQEQRSRSIDALNAALHACASREEACALLGAGVQHLFPRMNGALALGARADLLATVAHWGAEHRMLPAFARDDCQGLRHGEMHIDEPGREPACRHFTAPPAGASLCLPLVSGGDTLGLLHLDGAPLDAEERLLALRLGEVIAIAFADLEEREMLRLQAIRDPLTGLFNRLYLDETLPRECQLAARRGSPLSVAMIDVDHFKRFNDDYGHEAGDDVLRALGELLHAGIRGSDIACRYGGDEFTLVLLDTDLAAAAPMVERLRCDIKRHQCVYHGRSLPAVSVSIGMAEFPTHGPSPGDVLRAADAALYAAKRAGRDRIVLAPGAAAAGDRPVAPA